MSPERPFAVGPLRTVLLAVAATFLLFCREPESFLHPMLWAEDATVFYAQARDLGWIAFTRPYNGYYHLIPRLFAAPSAFLPAIYVPWWFNFAAIAMSVAAAVKISSIRWEFKLAPLMGLALMCVPHYGEIYVSLTNVQWLTAPLLVALALQRPPETGRQALSDFFWLFFAGLSGPFLIFVAPVYLAVIIRGPRSRYTLAVVGTAFIIVAIQLLFMLGSLKGNSPPSRDAWLAWLLICERIFDALLSGERLAGLLGHAWMAVLLPALALATAAIIWRQRRQWTSGQRFAVSMFLLAFVLLLLPTLLKYGKEAVDMVGTTNGDRYFFQPRLMLIWTLLAAWDLRGLGRYVASALLVTVLISAVVTTVHRERMVDYKWEQLAPYIDEGKPIEAPVNPNFIMKLEPRASS